MSIAEKMSTLEHLVLPMSRQEFLDYYMNQVPVFIQGGSPVRVAGLVDVAEVSEIVHQGLHPDGRIWLYQGGKRVPPESYSTRDARPRIDPHLVRVLLGRGASLVLNGIDEAHPKIGDLAHALELELLANVWANVYVTFNEGGALDIHFDDHDVIVLQVSGSKRWRLFGKTEEFPLHPGKTLGRAPTIEQHVDVLTPGEVLFIPRGEWHRAEVVESPSFHITFGVGGMTGLDLVKSAIDDLGEESGFRKYLPRIGGDEALRDHEEKLRSYLHDWVDRLSARRFLDDADSARRSRSRVILWNEVHIDNSTRLCIAARRIPSAQLLDPSNAGNIQIAGRTHHFDSTELVILRIAFNRFVLTFDELVAQVRAWGNMAPDTELSSAVIRLVEYGVLNAENQGPTRPHVVCTYGD